MNFDFVLILASSFFCLQSNRPKNFSGSRYAVEQSPYTISTTSITNVSFEIEVKNKPIGENNCLINVKESLSKNTVFEYNSSDCSGDKIKNLHPATQYEITLEPNESIYSGNSTASVTTKHSVSFIMKDISTISVTITITFTPIIDFETERCSIVLSKDSIIVNEQNSTSCIEANFSKLIPGTKYDVDLIYINYTYSTGFGTLSDHTLELIESNLTCTSVQIDKNFNPNVYNPEKEQCTNILLEGDSKTISCIGVNCESSCLSNSYTNLTPSTIYTFVSSSYPYITSVATKIRFITKSYTPYILSFSNIEANGFIVSIENRPTVLENCKLNVTEEITGTITIFNQSDECYNFTVTDLLPATQYIIYLEASNDVYCNQANASIRTTELKRSVHVLETNLTSIKLSSISFYEELDVTDTCQYNISSKYDNFNKSYNILSCSDFTISGLRPGNQYIIVTGNKYSTSSFTFNAKTKIQDPIYNLTLSLQKFNLLIQWCNNNSVIYPIIYEFKLYILNGNSDLRTAEIIFGTKNCNSSCNSTIFNDLTINMKYRIEICALPKDAWCNDLDKNDHNCYFCNSEEFYYPQKIQSDSNRVFYNKTLNVINITYIPPREEQFGNISYCFISMSQVNRRYDREVEFNDILDQPMISGNQWFTIKVLNGTDCANGNFTLIPLKYKNNITLHSIDPGFLYYSAVTFCSKLLCSTAKIHEILYISSSADKIITAAFLTCLILAIILYLIAISLVICGYKKKPTEKTGSNDGDIKIKNLILDTTEVSSEAPSEKKTVDHSKFEDKQKIEYDMCTANEVPSDHSSTTNDEQRITSQIFTYEDKISVNDKNESEQKETVMIAETRSRSKLNPEMQLKIKKLESDGASLKFKKNVAEIKVVPNMEIDLIKVVDIDRSFDQMIDSKDKKLVKQYSILNKIEPNSMAVGVTPDNKKLNRYSNIIPGDEHRIVLNKNYSKNAYINASKIHGISSEFDYIATQGPQLDTVEDFYSMILENNVKTVVMLTNLFEGGKLKCDQYLPLNKVTCNFGEFKITQKMVDLNDTNIADSKIEAAIKSMNLQIKDIGTDVSDVIVEFQNIKHIFRHFHYKIWPYNSVPNDFESLIELRKIMRDWHGESRTPIVVHSSAGVGRTGSFICFDYNLCRLENLMDTFSVYGYVSSIRKRRPLMVETYEQYRFIHKLLSRVAQ